MSDYRQPPATGKPRCPREALIRKRYVFKLLLVQRGITKTSIFDVSITSRSADIRLGSQPAAMVFTSVIVSLV